MAIFIADTGNAAPGLVRISFSSNIYPVPKPVCFGRINCDCMNLV